VFGSDIFVFGNNAIPGDVQSIVQEAIGNLYNSVRKTAVGIKFVGAPLLPQLVNLQMGWTQL